jgi:hypothetical protein
VNAHVMKTHVMHTRVMLAPVLHSIRFMYEIITT